MHTAYKFETEAALQKIYGRQPTPADWEAWSQLDRNLANYSVRPGENQHIALRLAAGEAAAEYDDGGMQWRTVAVEAERLGQRWRSYMLLFDSEYNRDLLKLYGAPHEDVTHEAIAQMIVDASSIEIFAESEDGEQISLLPWPEFPPDECADRNTNAYYMQLRFLRKLRRIRRAAGRSFRIVRGYSTPATNAALGEHPEHPCTYGAGLEIRAENHNPLHIRQIADGEKLHFHYDPTDDVITLAMMPIPKREKAAPSRAPYPNQDPRWQRKVSAFRRVLASAGALATVFGAGHVAGGIETAGTVLDAIEKTWSSADPIAAGVGAVLTTAAATSPFYRQILQKIRGIGR